MPQVTLSVPKEKLSLLKELLEALGIEENKKEETSSIRQLTDNANAFLKRHFSWENNKNELEFE